MSVQTKGFMKVGMLKLCPIVYTEFNLPTIWKTQDYHKVAVVYWLIRLKRVVQTPTTFGSLFIKTLIVKI